MSKFLFGKLFFVINIQIREFSFARKKLLVGGKELARLFISYKLKACFADIRFYSLDIFPTYGSLLAIGLDLIDADGFLFRDS